MKKIKRYKILPPLLLLVGVGVYVWDGLQWNSWGFDGNLGKLTAYVCIVLLLGFMLWKKEQIRKDRK